MSENQKSRIKNQESKISKVGIIGAGTMGSGIAQVAATAGCTVKLFDLNADQLENAASALENILNRLVQKSRIDEAEKSRIQQNIHYINKLEELADSDLTIEAIVENLEVKKKVFSQLENIVSKDCIIASNTSSLSITSIAASLEKPERCIGIHFFNPAPLMKLVEIIPAVQTEDQITETSVNTIKGWGKTTAVAKDTPGFIVNRVARPFYSEALRMYEEGMADIPTLDKVVRQMGFRMGPFELMDFIGHDVNYVVTESVFGAFYFDPRYKPSLTQKRLVEAGWLGKKSGRGFYKFENGNKIEPEHDPEMLTGADVKAIQDRLLVMLINEAADALYLQIATAEDLDNAMTKGVNYPKGLLAWADEKGLDWCVNQLDALYDFYREDRYRCSPLLRSKASKNEKFFQS
ncbi:3-hydroxybutyryl-CoA dehydrogenase [Nonlabens sp. YIK11]|uniref:3-hydroxyacyl-CoA dehydrogenase NAD-binding domain-containing protein n=1 Tax=Nonlabens sp. YIK11 TaxID=1453349 RepID=UPI0006DC9FF6|nr:3-hydroxyacyl-CoA dehydrogenase NAD-binding domain-containing protein [Nonlabens sp. YIK11]KQC34213.1 3-hydroxybutyryl-CoA dehydrogenase [Nonlabens sp. YIK11]